MTYSQTIELPGLPSTPRHAQIRESLRARILDGTYSPYAKLPTDNELSNLFGASINTIKQAVGDLRTEGVVVDLPGEGTCVAKPEAFQQLLAQLESFVKEMLSRDYVVESFVSSHQSLAVLPRLARRLKISVGMPVREIRRIRHINGSPLSLEITCLPEELGSKLQESDLQGRSVFMILEKDHGIKLGRTDLQISTISAGHALAYELQVPAGTTVSCVERLAHTADGGPFALVRTFAPLPSGLA